MFDFVLRRDVDVQRFVADNSSLGRSTTVKNNQIIYTPLNKVIGTVTALSLAHQRKSSSFSKHKFIIYDEFIAHDGRYLKDEVQKFLAYIMTIERNFKSDFKVICLGNRADVANPYMLTLKIPLHEKTYKDYETGIYAHQAGIEQYKIYGEEESLSYRLSKLLPDYHQMAYENK